MEREAALISLVKRYKTDLTVQKAINAQRKSSYVRSNAPQALNAYHHEARAYNLLEDDEIEALFKDIEQGLITYSQLGLPNSEPSKAAREDFIKLVAAHQVIYCANLLLVPALTRQYFGVQGVDPLDVIQDGNVGLARSIARHDIRKGVKFSTYAAHWIRQSAYRGIATKARLVRVPINEYEAFRNAMKQISELSIELGRSPTPKEIEHATGEYYEQIILWQQCDMNRMNYLDAPVGTDELTLGTMLEDPGQDPGDHIEALSDRRLAKELIEKAKLDDSEKFVIGLKFGIDPELIGTQPANVKNPSLSYRQAFLQTSNEGEADSSRIARKLGTIARKIDELLASGLSKLAVAAGMDADDRGDA